jgi:hypothetical protein
VQVSVVCVRAQPNAAHAVTPQPGACSRRCAKRQVGACNRDEDRHRPVRARLSPWREDARAFKELSLRPA